MTTEEAFYNKMIEQMFKEMAKADSPQHVHAFRIKKGKDVMLKGVTVCLDETTRLNVKESRRNHQNRRFLNNNNAICVKNKDF